jgi:hypothetical protein
LLTKPGQVAITIGMSGFASRTSSACGRAAATIRSTSIRAISAACSAVSDVLGREMRFSVTRSSPSTYPSLRSSSSKAAISVGTAPQRKPIRRTRRAPVRCATAVSGSAQAKSPKPVTKERRLETLAIASSLNFSS